jgi:hypothetical protein
MSLEIETPQETARLETKSDPFVDSDDEFEVINEQDLGGAELKLSPDVEKELIQILDEGLSDPSGYLKGIGADEKNVY